MTRACTDRAGLVQRSEAVAEQPAMNPTAVRVARRDRPPVAIERRLVERRRWFQEQQRRNALRRDARPVGRRFWQRRAEQCRPRQRRTSPAGGTAAGGTPPAERPQWDERWWDERWWTSAGGTSAGGATAGETAAGGASNGGLVLGDERRGSLPRFRHANPGGEHRELRTERPVGDCRQPAHSGVLYAHLDAGGTAPCMP